MVFGSIPDVCGPWICPHPTKTKAIWSFALHALLLLKTWLIYAFTCWLNDELSDWFVFCFAFCCCFVVRCVCCVLCFAVCVISLICICFYFVSWVFRFPRRVSVIFPIVICNICFVVVCRFLRFSRAGRVQSFAVNIFPFFGSFCVCATPPL